MNEKPKQEKINKDDLEKMALHDVLVTQGMSIVRVCGGWIYRDERAETAPVNTFVPDDN